MDVWSHDRNCVDHQEKIKRIGAHEGVKQGYRWQHGKLRETSVFPLTKLIMDVPFRGWIKALGRRVEEQSNDQYVLREEPVAYNSVFDHQKRLLSSDNGYFFDLILII